MVEPTVRVKETALLFGAGKSLVGVISDPPDGEAALGRPAVVLLNAGLLHRVGPNRLYVKLARRLAASGSVAARFDLSGVGDSPASGERSGFSERAVAETRACMDLLAATRGVRDFIVGGVCSGADNALQVAREDVRVVGAALMEPVSAPTAGHMVHSYRARLLRPRSWLRLVTGRSEAWSAFAELLAARRARRRGSAAGLPTVAAAAPESPGVAMRRFGERGGALCLVYSADNPAHYNYRTILSPELEGLPANRVRVEVITGTDHVFTPLEAQAGLLDILCDWVSGVKGGGGSA
jgi:hypothetical protein